MLSLFKGFSGRGATIRDGALIRRNMVCSFDTGTFVLFPVSMLKMYFHSVRLPFS